MEKTITKEEQRETHKKNMLVALGGYATHYGFTISHWLKTKDKMKQTARFNHLTKKLI